MAPPILFLAPPIHSWLHPSYSWLHPSYSWLHPSYSWLHPFVTLGYIPISLVTLGHTPIAYSRLSCTLHDIQFPQQLTSTHLYRINDISLVEHQEGV